MVALVQSTTGTGQGVTSLTLTLSSTTAGNCLVVAIASQASISSVKLGTSADNWASQVSETSGPTTGIYIWADPNCAGSQTSVVITPSASTNICATVYEFSGIATSSPLDKSSVGFSSTGVTSWSSGTTATTTAAAEAWVGAVGVTGTAPGPITGPSAPWTNATQLDSGTIGANLLAGYQITSSTGTATYSGTFGSNPYNAAVVTLKSAITPKSVSDSGSGSDSVAVSATVPLADSGTGADSVAAGPLFPSNPLGTKVELLLNGTWTDITSFVYSRDVIHITSGRPDESSAINPGQGILTLNNRDGRFSPKNSSGAYYPFITRNTQLRVHVQSATASSGYNGYRFWGEVSTWPPQSDPSQKDIFVTVTASGYWRRLQQGAALGSALYRYYTRLTGNFVPIAYWPCQDGTGATAIAEVIAGADAGTFTGSPSFATDTAFGGSDPLPQLNGSVWTLLTGVTGNPAASGTVTQTTPGTYQWTAPPGVSSVTNVQCTAAGGGAGAASQFSNATDGTDGGDSYFTGDSVTVRAHGGKHGTAGNGSNGTAGLGGTGSNNTTHFNGGGGAPGGFNDGGGGSSAGTASAGNAATSASGAAAVTGGGPGGNAGSDSAGSAPASGPGGGGGAGEFSPPSAASFSGGGAGGAEFAEESSVAVTAGTTYTYVVGAAGQGGGGDYPGGNGYAGQVSFSWNSGATVPVAGNILRFPLHVPSGGGVDGAVLAQMKTLGTIATVKLVYHTGGNLELFGYNSSNSQLFDSGSISAGVNGTPLLISVELTPSGTSTNWALYKIAPGLSQTATTIASGTVASAGVGAVTEVDVNVGGTDTGSTGLGHVTVQYYADTLANVAAALSGYDGERAMDRFTRLCTEQGIGYETVGNASDTPQMGPQPDMKLADVLQQIEDADRGLLFEPRDKFGLGYRTRKSMQNQAAVATIDYSAGELLPPLTPVVDDQQTRNDVTVTRTNGSSARAALTTGSLSTQAPPNGVGDYTYGPTLNLHADSQLANAAQWILDVGTVDEHRFPEVNVELARPADAGIFATVASLSPGDYFEITNPPSWLTGSAIKQLAYGFSETLSQYQWTFKFNAVPEAPYEGAGLPSW